MKNYEMNIKESPLSSSHSNFITTVRHCQEYYTAWRQVTLSFVAQKPVHILGRLVVQVPYVTHSHTLGNTSLNDWLARRTGRYLHNMQQTRDKKNHALNGIRTVNDSYQTHDLNRAAAGIDEYGCMLETMTSDTEHTECR